ncbi:glycosyltransferase family 2 protein [Schaalia naturae]|uniref:Glycosyltransferase family 2 protein n=1 Tax=Schaalia naturae TaxID=635203 RepID=A0ABW2SJ39_9ACTO
MLTTPVAVITRTRNRPVFLHRALRSVSAQTFEDLVHVVVNDGGDLAEVERAVAALPDRAAARVLVVDNEHQRGREAMVNVGLDATRSEFFAIHDDDDWWEPSFLERTIAHLVDRPGEVAVFTRCDVVHEHLEDGQFIEDSREVLAADLHSVTLVDTMVANTNPPIAQVVRRTVADRIGHWDDTLEVQADWEFTLRLLLEGPVGFIDGEPLAHWSHRPPIDGEAGNSVVSERQEHHDINLQIRDRYLRAAEHAPVAEASAVALTTAEYFRRLDQHVGDALGVALSRASRSASDHTQHIDAVHADLVRAISEQNARLEEMSTKLDELLARQNTWQQLRSRLFGGRVSDPPR